MPVTKSWKSYELPIGKDNSAQHFLRGKRYVFSHTS